MSIPLIPEDFKRAATDLGAPVAAIRAVASVESRGAGYLSDCLRPVILFERHIMRRQLIKHGHEKLIDGAPADLVNTAPGGYKGGAAEWDRLARAIAIDRESALESASWGMFQIMGYQWELLGYASAQALVNAMYSGERGQLDAFVRFIKANPNLLTALRKQDWAAFAKGYNGVNYAANAYDTKLAAAFGRFSKELA